MTNRKESGARELACSACGSVFGCNPAGPCWCADETMRLPMPEDGSDCLCPDCLRQRADAQRRVTQATR